jgi:hypothetical protein
MWNFDISQAPRSFIETVAVPHGENTRQRHVVRFIWIIAAYPGPGRKVGRTTWLPDEERWEGMTKGEYPIAWMPWPEYPEVS